MSFFNGGSQPVVYDYESQQGHLLDEDNDAFNDETFGSTAVGKDFDFAGQTAQVAGTLEEEHAVAERHQEPQRQLQPLAELWGQPQMQPQMQQMPGHGMPPGMPQGQPQGRPLTVEELEQQMIANLHMGYGYPQMQMPQMQSQPYGYQMMPPGMVPWYGNQGYPMPPDASQQQPQQQHEMPQQVEHEAPQEQPQPVPQLQQPQPQAQAQQPTEKKPKQKQAKAQAEQAPAPAAAAAAQPPSDPYQLKSRGRAAAPLNETRNAQLAQSSAEREKQASFDRAKLEQARYNGLMGDWDKNFILRIQLQQLISQDPYNEDFYYQVHNAIRARENPSQPLSDFAKTYLFRGGQRGRRNREKGDPLQRLQQQVQEAAERVAEMAKNRAEREAKSDQPKRTEGSLGQAKNSNAARPRTALVLPETNLSRKDASNYDEKYILRALEVAYDAVLTLEAHDRARPPPDHEDAAAWAAKGPELQDELWEALQVQSPLDNQGRQPFILMLGRDKGKKLVPRVFSHLDQRRRLTILTRIFHQVYDLDVIRDGVYPADGTSDLPLKTRKAIDLFSNTVLQPLQHFIGEQDLSVVVSLFDLLMRAPCGLAHIASTRIGQAFITIMISRAELLKQEGQADQQTLALWAQTFDQIFAQLQSQLSALFPPRHVENSYVWHFLASFALAATLDHQRLLVDAVRDRIFGTMAEAKSLPLEVGTAKISNLNLFLNVMGLNATFEDITELR